MFALEAFLERGSGTSGIDGSGAVGGIKAMQVGVSCYPDGRSCCFLPPIHGFFHASLEAIIRRVSGAAVVAERDTRRVRRVPSRFPAAGEPESPVCLLFLALLCISFIANTICLRRTPGVPRLLRYVVIQWPVYDQVNRLLLLLLILLLLEIYLEPIKKIMTTVYIKLTDLIKLTETQY